MLNQGTLREAGDARRSYDAVSRVNHWVVALVMLAALGAGLAIEYLPFEQETRRWLLGWHKTIGVMVLVAGVWRLAWRLKRGFPAPAAPAERWQELAAQATHWALLAATILMPLSGIVMTVFEGRAVEFAGSLAIPALGEIAWLAEGAQTVHAVVGTLVVGLIGLHVGAALKHHLVDRDATLTRMTSG